MALLASALTTVCTARDELGLDADPIQDTRLERYIQASSTTIARLIGRRLERSTQTDRLRGLGWPLLRLPRRPVTDITEVRIQGGLVDPDAYSLEDPELGLLHLSRGWPWAPGLLRSITYPPIPGTEAANVSVAYTGGWLTPAQEELGVGERTLPHDLEDACLQLVSTRWAGQGADRRIRSESLMSASYSYGGDAIPPEVAAVIERYTTIPHA